MVFLMVFNGSNYGFRSSIEYDGPPPSSQSSRYSLITFEDETMEIEEDTEFYAVQEWSIESLLPRVLVERGQMRG